MPDEFFAVAERTGLTSELGMWALTTACTRAARWRKDRDVNIWVNVSALQLRTSDFDLHVVDILVPTGLPAAALGLEITETMCVADTSRVAGTLTALHEAGVTLSLDDFGKGHSSIAYLARHPMFECFKIDRSYIAALPGTQSQAIVAAIVALAAAFDVTVVAEGVESVEQLAAVRALGCDLAQGYLMGAPVTAETDEEMLNA